MRWAMALQTYNYMVEYRKESNNSNADGLSWQELDDIVEADDCEGGGVGGTTAGNSLQSKSIKNYA